MGVIRATAYPSRYVEAFNREWEENEAVGQEREYAQRERVARLYAAARVRSPWFRDADAQREIARTLGLAMNVKPLYTRNRGGSLYDRGWYDIGDWRICGKHVLTENFTLDTMPCVLKSLEALGRVCAGRRAGAPLCTEALQHGDGDERLYHSGRTARACGDGAGA